VVDWHEVWGRKCWRSYLGPLRGRIGFAVQALCLRCPDRSFAFSRLASERAASLGLRGPITRLTGEFVENREGAQAPGGSGQERRYGPPRRYQASSSRWNFSSP
jgi:hypothetical protein